jgi:hypothetical protein
MAGSDDYPGPERVVLAVDPHKASWTAAVVDHTHRVLAQLRVPASRDGYRQLRHLARRWPAASLTWAIEGAHGLGLPLTERLTADGIVVVDVPAKLSARVRLLATGQGRKTDMADAVATAIAALTATRLRTATIDEHTASLRLLSDHRDDLVRQRTQTLNRLHVLLVWLVPAGAPRRLTADAAARLLRAVRPRTPAEQTRRAPARDLVAEVQRLDGRIADLDTRIAAAVAATGSTLPQLWHRAGPGRQDPRPGRCGQPVRVGGGVRRLLRRGPDRGLQRRRGAPSTLPRRGSPPCMSWPSPRSAVTVLPGPTTCTNEPRARVARRRCGA